MSGIPAVVYLKPHKHDDDESEDKTDVSDFLMMDEGDGITELQMETLKRKIEVEDKSDSSDFLMDAGARKIELPIKTLKRKTETDDHNLLKDLLIKFDREISRKLRSIEEKLDVLSNNWDNLEDKVECISTIINRQAQSTRLSVAQQNDTGEENSTPSIPISSRKQVTYITLNSEDDFPNGSWLGNEKDLEHRVRCKITPLELFHINTTYKTAEKMTSCLLDLLFDRETQACSNLCGSGKYKKKQLDPLFIYGIKCHLKFHFNITDQEWNELKLKINSKCRAAFLRKTKGLPLISNFHPTKNEDESNSDETNDEPFTMPITFETAANNSSNEIHSSNLTFQEYDSTLQGNMLLDDFTVAQLICTNDNLETLHAMPEEVAQIRQTPNCL